MQMIGFVLFCIGIFVVFFARRVVMAKISLQKEDEEEINLLTKGAVIAVRMAGFVVAAVGFLFLMI